jgi:hypothetical protein
MASFIHVSIACIHEVNNVFHVSLLKKYVLDPKHIIDWNVIQVKHKGDLRGERVCILDQKAKIIKNKCNIPLWRTDKTYSLRTLARK